MPQLWRLIVELRPVIACLGCAYLAFAGALSAVGVSDVARLA